MFDRLWRFHGGLKLPGHKQLSLSHPLATAPLPEQLIFPLMQRPGVTAKPIVAVGERVLRGQVVAQAEQLLGVPIIASSSGTVVAVDEPRAVPHPSGLPGPCLVIATDGLDEALPAHPCPDFRELPPPAIREKIRAAGIVGLGGAAFPAAIKLNPGPRRQIDLLVVNGAECEPYITCDDQLLQTQAHDVVCGAQILLHLLGLEQGIIAVEADMQAAEAALRAALTQRGETRLTVRAVPVVYPTGGEKQLIYALTGRETPSGGIPADIGVICQNVGTAAAIYHAIVQGKPLTERIVTVTGQAIRQPQNLRVRIGTPAKTLIDYCGGYRVPPSRLIMGGPMMGFALTSDEVPVVKATNCLLVASDAEVVIEKAAQPCIRCGACAEACPVELLPQQLYWYSRAEDLERCKTYNLFDCIECGCCEVVCPSHIPLVQYYRSSKSKIIQKNQEAEKAAIARRRHEMQLARKEKEKQERAERAKRKKDALAKKKALDEQRAAVQSHDNPDMDPPK